MRQLGTSLNAVHLREALEDDGSVHLVMELCEGGALLERVARRAHSEQSIARIVRSILRFIAQCHAKNIVYRDVKPDNFLFLSADEGAPLKATDFGLAIRHAPHEPKLTSRSGTPAYMAPELVMQCYDEKADLWSVGMLAYQLLTGRFPFWDDVREETLADVWKAVLSTPIDWSAPELAPLSASARDLLERLLQRNPVMRPSAAEALEHEWLREGEEGAAGDVPLAGSVVQRLQRYATYAHLKQVVLRLITEQMQQAGKLPGVARALRDLFKRLDLDGNGELSVDELIAGLREEVRRERRDGVALGSLFLGLLLLDGGKATRASARQRRPPSSPPPPPPPPNQHHNLPPPTTTTNPPPTAPEKPGLHGQRGRGAPAHVGDRPQPRRQPPGL
jgi:calcium-dependent protein kinase